MYTPWSLPPSVWLIIRPHCSVDSLHTDLVVYRLVTRDEISSWSKDGQFSILTTPVFCRTWSSKLTLNHILCLPVSKDYKTKPSSSLKYLHAYTYPCNGMLIAFHVPVFLKLEKKLSSEEKGMVFQASWSDYSNSIHSVTQALHLPRNYSSGLHWECTLQPLH